MKPMLLGAVLLVLVAGVLAACQRKAAEPAPIASASAAAAAAPETAVQGPERRILALGDSLFAGYGLRPEQAYPVRLEAALRAKGINARITNAGVSGDTTADGLARLNFTLANQPRTPDLVIISLGGNDMLRGLPPAEAEKNLDAILGELARRKVKVVIMGMLAAPNMGREFSAGFNPIFPRLAKKHGAALVPFFLQAVVDKPELRLPDRIHPTAQGVEAMVGETTGVVEKALPPAQ